MSHSLTLNVWAFDVGESFNFIVVLLSNNISQIQIFVCQKINWKLNINRLIVLFSQVKNILLEHAFEVSSFLFFVGPMTLICVLYVLIGVKLRKSKLLQGVKRRGCEFGRGISGQTRVIRMLGKFHSALSNHISGFYLRDPCAAFNQRNSIRKTFSSICFRSCRCCGVFLVLGTISCTTIDGCLWENIKHTHELYISTHLHCPHLCFGRFVLHVDVYQSIAL